MSSVMKTLRGQARQMWQRIVGDRSHRHDNDNDRPGEAAGNRDGRRRADRHPDVNRWLAS